MVEKKTSTRTGISKVLIYSSLSFLAFELANELAKNFCSVFIYSEEPRKWDQLRRQLKINSFNVVNKREIEVENFDYFLFVKTEKLKSKSKKEFSILERLIGRKANKSLLIFNYLIHKNFSDKYFTQIENKLPERSLSFGCIFTANALPFFQNKILAKYFKKNQQIAYIENAKNEKVSFILDVSLLAQEIVKRLFSLSAYGRKIALLSSPVNLKTLPVFAKVKAYRSDPVGGVDDKIYLQSDLSVFSQKTIEPILQKDTAKRFFLTLSAKKYLYKFLAKGTKYKFNLVAFLFLCLFIFIPIVFNIFGLLAVFYAEKSLDKEKGLTLGIPPVLGRAGSSYLLTLSNTRVVGRFYKSSYRLASVSQALIEVQNANLKLEREVSDVIEKIGNGESGYSDKLSEIALIYDALFTKLGFLEGELASGFLFSEKIDNETLLKRVASLRATSFFLADLADESVPLLGFGKPQTYLLLFQDNGIARPGGGLIRGAGIITVSEGEIIDKSVFSTQDIDNLAGYVEPPLPLAKYFDKTSWTLRDANWDPDFSVSATRAEWFLDKDKDLAVDGVISIDSSFLVDILERPQAEIFMQEDDFIAFASEGIDALFLTRPLAVEKLHTALVNKNIQIFLHSKKAQNALTELGWDGSLAISPCNDICYSDFLAIVESRPEEGSFNDIKKQGELFVSFEEGLIKRRLVVFFDNSESDKAFKTYLRVWVPGDSGFGEIELVDRRGGREKIAPEAYAARGFKEGGVWVEVPGGAVVGVLFRWESESQVFTETKGEYQFLWRKQPGEKDYPAIVNFAWPEGAQVVEKAAALTKEAADSYNTPLPQKFIFTFSRGE